MMPRYEAGRLRRAFRSPILWLWPHGCTQLLLGPQAGSQLRLSAKPKGSALDVFSSRLFALESFELGQSQGPSTQDAGLEREMPGLGGTCIMFQCSSCVRGPFFSVVLDHVCAKCTTAKRALGTGMFLVSLWFKLIVRQSVAFTCSQLCSDPRSPMLASCEQSPTVQTGHRTTCLLLSNASALNMLKSVHSLSTTLGLHPVTWLAPLLNGKAAIGPTVLPAFA